MTRDRPTLLDMQDPYDLTSALWVLILVLALLAFVLLMAGRCLNMLWWRLASAMGSKWAQQRQADGRDRAQARVALIEILSDGETLAMLCNQD